MSRGLLRNDVTDAEGNAVQGALVTVYVAGTLTKATLYSESVGGVIIANPLTTDVKGVFQSFVETGEYDLAVVTAAGTENVYNIPVLDADDVASIEANLATSQQQIDDLTAISKAFVRTPEQTISAQTVVSVPEITDQTADITTVFLNGSAFRSGYSISAGQVVFDNPQSGDFWALIPFTTPIGTTTAGAVTDTSRGQSVQETLDSNLIKTPDDFGDVSGDATALIEQALSTGVCLIQKPYQVTQVSMPDDSILVFIGEGKLIATTVSAPITMGERCTIFDPIVDMNGTAYTGIRASTVGAPKIIGRCEVYNAATGGGNVNGGVSVISCTDFEGGDFVISDVRQNTGVTSGLYRALEITGTVGFSVDSVETNNCDIGINLFNSQNGKIGAVNGKELTDNGIYIINASEQIDIGEISLDDCGEGLVLNSSLANANITITKLTCKDAGNKGITCRSGGGYTIGTTVMVDSLIGQDISGGEVFDGLTIGTLYSYLPTRTDVRCVSLTACDGVSIGHLVLHADNPQTSEAARFTECDRLRIGHADIFGTGATLSKGINLVGAGALDMFIGGVKTNNVTTPVLNSVADDSNVCLAYEGTEVCQQKTLISTQGATIQLERDDVSNVAGDLLGQIQAYSNDASGAGVKFRLKTTAQGGNGALAKTEIEDDAGVVVGLVGVNVVNEGMTVKLPTSSSGLSSGMIWNNAGAITVVP